jgi:hypothetical protein
LVLRVFPVLVVVRLVVRCRLLLVCMVRVTLVLVAVGSLGRSYQTARKSPHHHPWCTTHSQREGAACLDHRIV